MTEQPGPGHMIMAAARMAGRRRMGACETHSARHAPGTGTRPRISQSTTSPSSALMILRRWPALQLDSWPRAGQNQAAARKDPEE